MDYSWIGAAAAAAAQGASALAMSAKKRGSTRMMKVSKELAEFNNAMSVRNWQMENAYNTPAAQMQRYQDAGLNPNLIYGQENTGGSIAGGAVDTNPEHYQGESKAAAALAGMAQAISQYQQLRSQQIANSNANLAGDLTRENIIREKQNNEYNAATKEYRLEQEALRTQAERFRVYERNHQELENLKADIAQKQASTQKILSDKDLDAVRKRKLEREIDHYGDMKRSIDSAIEVNDARIRDMADQAQNRSAMLGLGWARYGLDKGRFDFEKEKYGDLAPIRKYQELGTMFDTAIRAKDFNYYDQNQLMRRGQFIDNASGLFGLGSVLQSFMRELRFKRSGFGR